MSDETQQPPTFTTATFGRLTFDDEADLMTYVVRFGQEQGMAITIRRTRKLNNALSSIDFKCDRGGKYYDRRTRPAVRSSTGTRLVECPFVWKASKLRTGWNLRAINNDHNHELSSDMSGHP